MAIINALEGAFLKSFTIFSGRPASVVQVFIPKVPAWAVFCSEMALFRPSLRAAILKCATWHQLGSNSTAV